RYCLRRLDLKADVPDDVCALDVGEGHTVELGAADHIPVITAGVLVQIRLCCDQLEDTAGAGDARGYLRVGHEGDVRGEVEERQQADVGDDVANRQGATAEEQKGVGKADGVRQAEQENGQETRLDAPLLDAGVAVGARIEAEALDLLVLLSRTLDRLDAVNGFGQAAVQV